MKIWKWKDIKSWSCREVVDVINHEDSFCVFVRRGNTKVMKSLFRRHTAWKLWGWATWHFRYSDRKKLTKRKKIGENCESLIFVCFFFVSFAILSVEFFFRHHFVGRLYCQFYISDIFHKHLHRQLYVND